MYRLSKSRRASALTLLLAWALAFVVAVPGAWAEPTPELDGEGSGPIRVTVMLDWVANANHVGFFVARDLGFFQRAGLEVEIVEPGEVWATSAVLGGQAEFGIDFQENLTLMRADDVPLVSIAAIMQTNTSGFATRASDRISSPAQFAGLTYGTFNSPFEEPTLSSLVRCAGGDPDGITYVTAGTDLLAMLDQGLADVVWIYYGTQGFQAERLGIDLDYFPLNDYQECIPDYYTPVVITSQAMIDEQPEVVRRFVGALVEAHEFVMRDPVAAADVLADAFDVARANIGVIARQSLHHVAEAQRAGQQVRRLETGPCAGG